MSEFRAFLTKSNALGQAVGPAGGYSVVGPHSSSPKASW